MWLYLRVKMQLDLGTIKKSLKTRKEAFSASTISNVGKTEPRREGSRSAPEESYRQSVAEYGAALDRLAYAYEVDPELRRDLLQEVHLALWRSFANFDEKCSLRTWTYRVAHNVAASHVAAKSNGKGMYLSSLLWRRPRLRPVKKTSNCLRIAAKRSLLCWH
jgi:hypothetical protein